MGESFNWKVFILLVGIVKIERRMSEKIMRYD